MKLIRALCVHLFLQGENTSEHQEVAEGLEVNEGKLLLMYGSETIALIS